MTILSEGAFSLLIVSAATAQQGPVSQTIRSVAQEEARNLRAAAVEMPAGRYGFRPTRGQRTFGEIVVHIHDDNRTTCGAIAGQAPPAEERLLATASKEVLLAALDRSLAFCDAALAGATDATLGDSVTYYGDGALRARPLVGIVEDWASHYSQLAMYLRLNGILPPTARPAGG
jgi:hypothetical protein